MNVIEIYGALQRIARSSAIVHINELIRQYPPKKTDFTKVNYKTIKMIQNRLNKRPRKVLGYKTPKKALLEVRLKVY